MKKYQIIIALMCCIILPQNTIAQIPELFIYEWELDHLIIDGEEVFPPTNNELQHVRILFDETPNDNPETPYSVTSIVCDAFFSSVVFEDNTIETFRMGSDYVETLGECSVSENQNFQGTYFSFYVEFLEDPYEYQITFAEDDSLVLQVFSPNGDVAAYNSLTLSVNEVTETSFSIYPNPVQDQFTIQTDNEIGNYTATVFDIQGKTLLSVRKEALTNNTIYMQNWASGLYFIRVEDQNGSVTTKRFIKR